jgi:hypothetical protein
LPGVKPRSTEKDRRFSSGGRGVVIAALIAVYGWFMHTPTGSSSVSFLAAAGLQLLVIALRRFVPADLLPQALYVFEFIADGVTVLLFALGVFGGIAHLSEVQ